MPATWMGITACMVILFLNGCIIISHRPLPSGITLTPSPKGSEVIRLSFHPEQVTEEKNDGRSPMGALPIEPAILQQYLEKYSTFTSAVISSSAPTKGTHIVLTRTVQPPPAVTQLSQFTMRVSCNLAVITLFILPCYLEDVSTLRYDVYTDDQLLKSYTYDLTTRKLTWTGVLPVLWVNLMTTTYSKSCENITIQFVTDARRDGYL